MVLLAAAHPVVVQVHQMRINHPKEVNKNIVMLKLLRVLIQMFLKENYGDMFLAGNQIIRLTHLTMTLIQTQTKTQTIQAKILTQIKQSLTLLKRK